MKTYRIEKTENKYLETITYTIYESELIDGKKYVSPYGAYSDEQAAISKMRWLTYLYQ